MFTSIYFWKKVDQLPFWPYLFLGYHDGIFNGKSNLKIKSEHHVKDWANYFDIILNKNLFIWRKMAIYMIYRRIFHNKYRRFNVVHHLQVLKTICLVRFCTSREKKVHIKSKNTLNIKLDLCDQHLKKFSWLKYFLPIVFFYRHSCELVWKF